MINRNKFSYINCFNSYKKNRSAFIGFYLRGFIATSTVIAKKSLLIKAGGFDPNLPSGQDYEFWLAALDLPNIKFFIINEPLTRYHISPKSISSKIILRKKNALKIAECNAHRISKYHQNPALILAIRTFIIYLQASYGFLSKYNYCKAIIILLIAPFKFFLAFKKKSIVYKTRSNFLK